MEGTFGKIRNFFTDGIFGNVIRFLFDRFFGSIFTTNINFSNIINLKNCHFQNLNIDAEKINKKVFKNGPFKLFSGKVGSISMKFPSLNALLTESLEVCLGNLDILLVMNDVDFSQARHEAEIQLAKLLNPENLQNIIEDKFAGGNAEEFDVYKKIINRMLFNIKLKVENVCVRIVSEKPYKDVRLPVAPCFMLKIGRIDVKKKLESEPNSAELPKETKGNFNFMKNQNYEILISGITMHLMSNYELKPDEYMGKIVDPKAEFPFSYPKEDHPSTIFVCACRKTNQLILDSEATDNLEPIKINVNFSNDKSKSVDIEIPNIEVMLDFLKIKFLSKYIDKLMEWKKFLDYKKALVEQLLAQKKSPKFTPAAADKNYHLRKGSFGLDLDYQDPDSFPIHQQQQPDTSHKVRIAGFDIDMDYFEKNKERGENGNDGDDNQIKSEIAAKVDVEEISEMISEPFALTPESLLDTSNVKISFRLKSLYIYFLKTCTAFLDSEFKRWWLFGSEQQADLQRSFNKKIPLNYFQLKLTKMEMSLHTKEGLVALTFSSLKVLDINREDTPLRLKSSTPNSASQLNVSTMNKSQAPWNKSDIFYSIKMDRTMMMGNTLRGLDSMAGHLRATELKRNPSVDPNNESMLFQSAMSEITKDFLQLREIRKPIIDWEIDPKKEHFCINVVFKLNKNPQGGYSKGKGPDTFKTVKYLEDSVIHSPLNTDALTEDLPSGQSKPSLRLSNKGGKTTASLDLPAVYVNFYMSLVHDINFLLHHASDSYKISEIWYLEQNQFLLKKWEQEAKEASKEPTLPEDPFKQQKENQLKDEVDKTVDAYFKRQNLLMNLELTLSIPLIKIVLNLENPRKEANQCFCGFSSLYFEENLFYHPIFKKEFVVVELSQVVSKVLKMPSNEYAFQDSKKLLGFNITTLFQNLNVFIPLEVTDENKVLMTKILSLCAIQEDDKMVIPSISIKTYEEESSFTKQPSPKRGFGSNQEFFKEDEIKQDQIPFGFANNKSFNSLFYNHMKKVSISNSEYLKLMDDEATLSIGIAFPKFEIYASKQSLAFLQRFSKDWATLIESVNEKLSHLIEQEKNLFSTITEINPKIPKVPSILNLSLYIEELSVQVYRDSQVLQNVKQMIDSKKKKVNISSLGSSAVHLDASFSAPILEKSYSSYQQGSEMRIAYPRREFERALASSFKVVTRHNELIIFNNPRKVIDIIHLEVSDLLIVDRQQENVVFGSFEDPKIGEKSQEYFDASCEYKAQECIVYKHVLANAWNKPLNLQRVSKEPELFKEWKNRGIHILENTHQTFSTKNKNVIGLGILKSIRDERLAMDVDVRIGCLVLRSDFRLNCLDLLKDLSSSFETKPEDKDKEELNSMDILEKKEPREETRIIIQVSIDHILLDLNPYLTYDYCKTYGKVNLNFDPENLSPEYKDLLFYSNTRSLLAIESVGLRLVKRGSKIQFDEFTISSLDLLMRQQKGDSTFKENVVLLQGKDNLFEGEFEELKTNYMFRSHPFYLCGLSVNSIGNNLQNVEIKLERIDIKIYSDSIPIFEKHIHLVMCLLDKRKHLMESSGKVPKEEEEKKEMENSQSLQASKSEAAKPKDQIILEEEIEIHKDYFAPLEVVKLKPKVAHPDEQDDGFEEIEENEEDKLIHKELEEDKMSFESLDCMNSASPFVSSSTAFYFDEDNLHQFPPEVQEVDKKITVNIGEVCLRIFECCEFDTNPQIVEVNMDHQENSNLPNIAKEINEKEKAECIMILFESFSLGVLMFKKNRKQRTNLVWRTSAALENFEIVDCFRNGKRNEDHLKILSKYNKMTAEEIKFNLLQSMKRSSEFYIQNTFDIIFECFENDKSTQKDLRAFVAIHPIQIHAGMAHYNFLTSFQANMNQRNPQAKPEEKPGPLEKSVDNMNASVVEARLPRKTSDLFVSFFCMAPFEVKMNVNLDISVFNFDVFKNLKLSFPTMIVRSAESPDELKNELMKFYNSSVRRQLGQFIKDLPLLRNIKNLTYATLNLFYSPYMNFTRSGNFIGGVKDGVVEFATSVSTESANLFNFVATTLDNVTDITGIKEKLKGNSR